MVDNIYQMYITFMAELWHVQVIYILIMAFDNIHVLQKTIFIVI